MNPFAVLTRTVPVLILGLAGFVSADPMPYDSIGNPLNRLPSTDRTIQRKGDSLNLAPNRVRVNQAGYRQRDVAAGYAKFYCVGCTGTSFSVRTAAGALAGTGTLTPKAGAVSGQVIAYASNSAEHAHNGEGDWKQGYPMMGRTVSGALAQGILPATLPTGIYTIRVGADSSVPFVVSENVYGMARDAALKFFGVARSGDYESWFHGPSHMWDGWLYDSAARNPDGTYKYKGALKGGWYDCGNHLKEARTNSYPLAALGMLAATMPEKDADRYALNHNTTVRTDGIPDVLREAWVGAQFVVNSWRLAKGKPADMILSVGELGPDFNWWGRPENHDAVLSPSRGGRRERRLHKNWGTASMADFAAGMAFLSRLYRPYDRAFADSAAVIAEAMYEGAKTANRDDAMPDYTADNTAFDDLGLAAVALLWATGKPRYLDEAIRTKGLPDGKGGVCKSTLMTPEKASRLFEGGFFACDPDDGMKKKGGPTDYASVQSLALYAFTKLILAHPDTAARYGISPAQRDTFLLRSITQMAGPLWGSSAGPAILIPTGDQYNPTRLTYDSVWYSMGIGYGKSGWWNKYQFGNLADLYLFYDMTSLVEGRAILDKPGNTDWKRKEVLQVLLGGLNYMFGTNALDLSYLYGIGDKNPMHPHHRGANPEGKNVPGAYYNYTIPIGGLYGGLPTGPANSEVLVEKFGGPVGQTEANCPDAQAAVIIPLMGLASETPVAAPKPTVRVLYTTDTSAVLQVDLDKWGTIRLGYGLDSSLAVQTAIVRGSDTTNTFRLVVNGLSPATQFFFHVVATDLDGRSSTTAKWPNGQSDSIPYSFTTKAQPALPPQYANIKVCNVTSDSAEIMWYTPNGEYLSSVKWADSASWRASRFAMTDSDAVGDVRVKFHRVVLRGLRPKTTYNFQVGVPGAYEPSVGCFRTPGEDVKFDIRATHYTWDGKPAMGIGVVNQDVRSYDSLQIRLYVNGTRAEILDLAARVDIAFAYRADGFADSGLFNHTRNVQKSRPQLIDPSCPASTSSCAWYFDLPLHGAVMETQARWRLDVVFDRHNLIRDSTEILNMPPTHDPFGPTSHDWSMRAHVAGADGGLSPLDYPGVPLLSKNAIDSMAMDIPVNPYIAVYRRNEFVYGFSPFAGEQATKRVVFAMDAAFQAPFDVANGNTVEIGSGTAASLKGTLDPHDVLLPAVKGYITAVWVNGVALTDAERRSALVRKADGTWTVDLPLRLVTGTNKLDVTFFAGSDSLDTAPTGACSEGKGCAFYNASWYVNHVSNLTPSLVSVVDGAGAPLGLVVPDSSFLRIRVRDGNANTSKTAKDGVLVSVVNARTGRTMVRLSLSETGANTGVFESELRAAVSTPAMGAQIQILPGDTLVVRYGDALDPADSAEARVWAYSGFSSSKVSVLDASGTVVGSIVPDASSLRLRVEDANANTARLLPDTVSVTVTDLRTLAVVTLRLPETGPNTGVFQSDLLAAVSGVPGAGQIRTIPGDTLRVRYRDASDPSDSSATTFWSTASWPLVSQAVLHRGCGGAPEVAILLDKSLLRPGQSAPDSIGEIEVRLWTPQGDSLPPITLSDAVASGPGFDRIVVRLPASASSRSDRVGTITLQVPDGRGSFQLVSGAVVDSIGPWIDSAKIAENLAGNTFDTVQVWVSEPLGPVGAAIPVRLFRGGAEVTPVVIDGFRLADAASNRWILTLPAGIARAGDSLALAGAVSDARGNPALDCPEHRRRIALSWRPTAVASAWIRDSDGDARADQVVLVYKRPLRAEELPGSLSVSFGDHDSLRQAPVAAKIGDSVVVVPIPPFFRSETRGSAAGGQGAVALFQGGVPLGSSPMADSVGPVLLGAILRYGTASDTLRLRFSEPVAAATSGRWLDLLAGTWTDLSPTGTPVTVDGRVWSFPVDTFRVVPGDSVRPVAGGRYADAGLRGTAAFHPAVVVEGAERPPTGGRMMDLDGDGAAETLELTWARAPSSRPAFVVRWPSLDGGYDSVLVAQDSWTPGLDPLRTLIPVGPFDRGATSSDRLDLGTMLSSSGNSIFPIHDAVAASALSARLRYAAADAAHDTLVVRWSEPVVWSASGPLLMVRNGGDDTAVQALVVVLDADARGAILLLDRTGERSTRFRVGDSVRLSPASLGAVADLHGNASEPGWRVPVQFGRRPPRFDVSFRPVKRVYGGWALSDKPAFDLQVRPRGSTSWQDLSTGMPVDTSVVDRQLGPVIVTNQPLRGNVLVYDNQGTFVAAIDLERVAAAFGTAGLPTDPSNQYEVRVAWNGVAATGKPSASGVYIMRLVLRQNLAGDGELPDWGIYNQTFQFGWEVPLP